MLVSELIKKNTNIRIFLMFNNYVLLSETTHKIQKLYFKILTLYNTIYFFSLFPFIRNILYFNIFYRFVQHSCPLHYGFLYQVLATFYQSCNIHIGVLEYNQSLFYKYLYVFIWMRWTCGKAINYLLKEMTRSGRNRWQKTKYFIYIIKWCFYSMLQIWPLPTVTTWTKLNMRNLRKLNYWGVIHVKHILRIQCKTFIYIMYIR